MSRVLRAKHLEGPAILRPVWRSHTHKRTPMIVYNGSVLAIRNGSRHSGDCVDRAAVRHRTSDWVLLSLPLKSRLTVDEATSAEEQFAWEERRRLQRRAAAYEVYT